MVYPRAPFLVLPSSNDILSLFSFSLPFLKLLVMWMIITPTPAETKQVYSLGPVIESRRTVNLYGKNN